MRVLLFATTLLLWIGSSIALPESKDHEDTVDAFKIKGFTARGGRRLGNKKGSKELKGKVPKKKNPKKKEKKNKEGDEYFSVDFDNAVLVDTPFNVGVADFNVGVAGLAFYDGVLQELLDECYSRENEVCYFAADYENPLNSECMCVPDKQLEVGTESLEVGIEFIGLCGENQNILSHALTAAGIAGNLAIAWATFDPTQAPPILWETIGWAALGEATNTGTLLLEMFCGEDEKPNLIEFFDEVKQYVEKYTQKMIDYRIVDLGTSELESIKNFGAAFDNVAFPPITDIKIQLSNLGRVQRTLGTAKMTGAALLATNLALYTNLLMKLMAVAEREFCDNYITQYVRELQNFTKILDSVRTDYEQLFFKEIPPKIDATCNSGGCFCLFCGAERFQAGCYSDIEGYTTQLEWGDGGYYDEGYGGHYTCTSDCSSAVQPGKDLVELVLKRKWFEDVDNWWNTNIKAAYDATKQFIDNQQALTNLCGHKCGPSAELGYQSCMCGALPYCDLNQGRCVPAKPAGSSGLYDCPSL